MNWWQALIITLLEKVGLPVGMLFLGLYASRFLERQKKKESVTMAKMTMLGYMVRILPLVLSQQVFKLGLLIMSPILSRIS